MAASIVLDTTVLVYAFGEEHPLRAPCRSLLDAARTGAVSATTAVPVIQEFAHVRARRRGRADAASLAADLAVALSPLLPLEEAVVERAVALFRAHEQLGAFDAFLAAVSLDAEADALVSADRAFAAVPGLNHVDPGGPGLDSLLAGRA